MPSDTSDFIRPSRRPRRFLGCVGLAMGMLLAGFVAAPASVEARSRPAEAGQGQARSTAPARRPASAPARVHSRDRSARKADPRPSRAARQAQAVSGLRRGVDAVPGAEPALLLAIAAQESSLDPKAASTRSTARGLMQFTRDTWLEAVHRHGARHGVGHLSRHLVRGEDGRITAARPHVIEQVLKLRDNPRLATALAAERLAHAQRTLEVRLGRPANATDLYLVHLLGQTGGERLLRIHAERPATQLRDAVGAAAIAANPELFGRAKAGMTVAQAYRELGGRLEARLTQQAGVLAALGRHGVELAEAR